MLLVVGATGLVGRLNHQISFFAPESGCRARYGCGHSNFTARTAVCDSMRSYSASAPGFSGSRAISRILGAD